MANPQEPNPFELACWAACGSAREVDMLRRVWRNVVIDAPEGWIDDRLEGKFEPIVGTVSRLTCLRKRSRDVFPSIEVWVRAVWPEAPRNLPGTPKAASYHDTAFELADNALWRFDTSLNWGARLLELINGPSVAAAELERMFNPCATGTLRVQVAERLRSIYGDPYRWGELRRAMESIEAFDTDDLITRIEHEAGRARVAYSTELAPAAETVDTVQQPEPEMFQAFWLEQSGQTQESIAEIFRVAQGTISKWLKKVRQWREAGNVFPAIPQNEPLHKKPQSMDNRKLDMGARADRHTPRQAEKSARIAGHDSNDEE